MMKLLRVSARGVRRNWRQSLAALIAIASGFVSLTLFQGYISDVQRTYEDANRERGMMGDLLVEGAGPSIGPEDQEKILRILDTDPRVFAHVRFLNVSGQITNGSTSMVFIGVGYDPAESARLRGPIWAWNTFVGHPLRAEDGESAVLGFTLAKILDCDVHLPKGFVNDGGGFPRDDSPPKCPFATAQLSLTTEKGQMNGIDVQVGGVTDLGYKEMDERYVAMPLATAQSLLDTKKITRLSVRMKNPKDIETAIEDYNQKFKEAGVAAHAMKWRDHALGDMYVRTMALLAVFRNFVVSVILIISCLSVFNTFMRNVSERSREIGTLRSLGFRPRHVAVIFLGEACLLALLGCLIGGLFSVFLEIVINGARIAYKPGVFSTPVPFRVALNAVLLLETALFMCLLISVTSWLSIRAAVRRPIVDCLGHT